MTKKRGSRRRGGWRRKGGKLQAYVRLFTGKGGLKTRTYPLDTAPSVMQDWIDRTWQKYRKRTPRAIAGTLRADVKHEYLPLLVDRPKTQQQRSTQLAWWCERFGDRDRSTLKAVELETALNELAAAGKTASTVNKYRTALYHLFTKLDGKNEPNPLRDVPLARGADPLPLALPYDIIEAIFEAIPDRRYVTKLDPDTAARIYTEATQPHANRSAVARAHGLSETMVRQIVARAGRRADVAAQNKLRLRVMAYTGLPPEQIRGLDAKDIDAMTSSVLVKGRKKGGGTRSARLPLVPAGLAALQALVAAGALGPFSSSGLNETFKRGITRMCNRLEAKPETSKIGAQLREELKDVTAYALRHSFLTEAQLATGNINATQGLAIHADARMTRRYTLAAVAPELQQAAAQLTARWGGQRAGNEQRSTASGDVEIRPKTARRQKREIGQSKRPKSRKSPMK